MIKKNLTEYTLKTVKLKDVFREVFNEPHRKEIEKKVKNLISLFHLSVKGSDKVTYKVFSKGSDFNLILIFKREGGEINRFKFNFVFREDGEILVSDYINTYTKDGAFWERTWSNGDFYSLEPSPDFGVNFRELYNRYKSEKGISEREFLNVFPTEQRASIKEFFREKFIVKNGLTNNISQEIFSRKFKTFRKGDNIEISYRVIWNIPSLFVSRDSINFTISESGNILYCKDLIGLTSRPLTEEDMKES